MATRVSKRLPEPVKRESRICFGIVWFSSEQDAALYSEHVRQRGETYNGGFFDGAPCGRDTGFDYTDPNLGRLYAVTTR